MLQLGKDFKPHNNVKIEGLSMNQKINLYGIDFRITNGGHGYYADGTPAHSDKVRSIEDILRRNGTSLHNTANTIKGYTGQGIFPEFKTLRDLEVFLNKILNIVK